MSIRIKNKDLYKKVMAKTDSLNKKQMKCIKAGNYQEADILDKQADIIYKRNYDKMFEITYKGKKLKSYKQIK
jgi:hypothetical protein